jgi:two-component sensor histidine kinase
MFSQSGGGGDNKEYCGEKQMTLDEICRSNCRLEDSDIEKLKQLQQQLPLMAHLCGADVFIDCLVKDSHMAVVVAQGRPAFEISAYTGTVVGEFAGADMEPAVLHCFELKAPVSDMKAVTQENKSVIQRAFPVFNDKNEMIAALVSERDISREIEHEKKFEHLARSHEMQEAAAGVHECADANILALREMHHRVKNDFQLMANIFGMQARRCRGTETEKILLEDMNRLLTIASIHDMLLNNSSQTGAVNCRSLSQRLCTNLKSLVPVDADITIESDSDDIMLAPDTAASVAMVLNELITNAITYAFTGKKAGCISVKICRGAITSTATVSDNGCGFDYLNTSKKGIGLRIADATVRDKLGGRMHIYSDSSGSRVSFDFRSMADRN